MTHALDDGGHRQLKDTVYRQLRDDIVTGVLPPGAVLREAELAARFGVSKTPLRDALVRLSKDGFVEIPPYRSAVVVGYSRTDLREIYELRELLEGACARQAAFHISADALAELSRIVRASAECVHGDEVIPGREDELTGLHDQFDLVMYAQSRNGRIDEMVGNIRGHIQRIGRLTTGIPGRLAKSVREHQAIYEAIVQRDGAAAESLMRRHILSVMADQLTSIADMPSAGEARRKDGPTMPTRTDTLVIGAGAAGLFCALRWAERGSVTVVEAGPDAGNPPPRWGLYDYVLPEAHYYRYTDAGTGKAIPQGRGLGGGSTVNSAAALRGQPWCYDGWQVPGWSWADCLEGFRAIESDQQYPDAAYHGADGLIPVTRLEPGPLDTAVFDWCRRAGHPAADDHNAPGALGYGVWTTNRRDGGRWGTWAGVVPAARQAGVRIRPDTAAGRLVFDGTRCAGADVTGPDGPERITAGRVIVCAGAYGSPALLMRSGIGPEPVLSRLGAEPVSVLPGVGANLMDHPWCLLDVDVTDPALIEARPVSGALLRYELDAARGEHVEAEIFPWQTRPYDLASPPTRVSFTAALMAPRSRGRFALTPAGPELHVGHLAEEADAADMAEIVATTAELLESLAKDGMVVIPEDAWWRRGDDLAAARAAASSYHHHSGTCRMGDPGAAGPDAAGPDAAGIVVGPDLAVLGTSGLAVADSSVMPVIPRANTNLASMMIGYRSGDVSTS